MPSTTDDLMVDEVQATARLASFESVTHDFALCSAGERFLKGFDVYNCSK